MAWLNLVDIGKNGLKSQNIELISFRKTRLKIFTCRNIPYLNMEYFSFSRVGHVKKFPQKGR